MELLNNNRKGFLLTNGSGCYIVGDDIKNELEERLANGWKIVAIRPICVSTAVKFQKLPPTVLRDRVYSYSLCILEKNSHSQNPESG